MSPIDAASIPKWNAFFTARKIVANVDDKGVVRKGSEVGKGEIIADVKLDDGVLDRVEIGRLNTAVKSNINTSNGIDHYIAQGWKLDRDESRQKDVATGSEAIDTAEVTAFGDDKARYIKAFDVSPEEAEALFEAHAKNGTLDYNPEIDKAIADRATLTAAINALSGEDIKSPEAGSPGAIYIEKYKVSSDASKAVVKAVIAAKYMSEEDQVAIFGAKLPKYEGAQTKQALITWWKSTPKPAPAAPQGSAGAVKADKPASPKSPLVDPTLYDSLQEEGVIKHGRIKAAATITFSNGSSVLLPKNSLVYIRGEKLESVVLSEKTKLKWGPDASQVYDFEKDTDVMFDLQTGCVVSSTKDNKTVFFSPTRAFEYVNNLEHPEKYGTVANGAEGATNRSVILDKPLYLKVNNNRIISIPIGSTVAFKADGKTIEYIRLSQPIELLASDNLYHRFEANAIIYFDENGVVIDSPVASLALGSRDGKTKTVYFRELADMRLYAEPPKDLGENYYAGILKDDIKIQFIGREVLVPKGSTISYDTSDMDTIDVKLSVKASFEGLRSGTLIEYENGTAITFNSYGYVTSTG